MNPDEQATNDTPLQGKMIAHASTNLPVEQEVAWQLVTDGLGLQKWYAFGGAAVEPVEGGRILLSWEDGKAFLGRVEKFAPPRRFDYRLPQQANTKITDDNSTLVQYLITEAPDNPQHTVVTVREHGFEELAEQYTPREAFSSSAVAWIGAMGL
ncbi:MAG: SRPBCC domain-containing protein, partial [Propionibacteriales bacterium]|nr:SRPBCC domain-containing protein [Propionibacteriales bacterium]